MYQIQNILTKGAFKMDFEIMLFGVGCVLGGLLLGSIITFGLMCFTYAIGESRDDESK